MAPRDISLVTNKTETLPPCETLGYCKELTDHSEHQDARNYRDVFSELDPHHELRNNPAMLGDEEAYRNLLAGDDHNVEELAAAAEKLLASRGTVDTPEAELDPHMLETLKALLADFDDQQMDSLERALAAYHDAYGEGGAVDDDDSMSAAETAAEARDFFSDYSGRIDIDTGEDAPDLGVYDDTAHPKEILDDTPTAEDYAALAAVEAELNTRWGERKIAPDLDRMRKLMDMLGHPEQATPVIQVGGTNGKSSTARMIDSLLRAIAGWLYHQPPSAKPHGAYLGGRQTHHSSSLRGRLGRH